MDEDDFIEIRKVRGEDRPCWSKEAKIFGRKFTSALLGLLEAITSESAVTPAPEWANNDAYRLAEEATIEIAINNLTEQVLRIEEQRGDLEAIAQRRAIFAACSSNKGSPSNRLYFKP